MSHRLWSLRSCLLMCLKFWQMPGMPLHVLSDTQLYVIFLFSCRIRWLKPEEYLTLFTYAAHFSIYDTQPKFIYLDPVACVYFIKCNALEFPRYVLCL